MPLDPRTWAPSDPVTASRLNNDLVSYLAQQFSPNGIRFHARRPFYKATLASATRTIGANSWAGIFGPGKTANANVLADTSADYGAHMDPSFTGTISDAVAFSNGSPNSPQGSSGRFIGGGGGWYLTSAFVPLNGASASNQYRANIASGFGPSGPNLTGTGSAQAGNASHDTCCFVVDLLPFNNGSYTPVAQNTGTGSITIPSSADGSGETGSFNAQWMSVYPQYGFTVAKPTPKGSWLSTDTVTATLLNGSSGIRDVLRILNMPPCLKVSASVSTSCTTAVTTKVAMNNVALDTYAGWNSTTSTYTVPINGIYLVYGAVTVQAVGSGTMPARCGVSVNAGTTLWGPQATMPALYDNTVTKLQILDLKVGDTVILNVNQKSGSTLGTGTNIPPVLIMAWLGDLSAPSPLVTILPDISYRYPAGTPATSTVSTLNAHLANDLSFLIHRPFLLARQNTAQAIANQSTDTQLIMDTINGAVHATAGDPYSGWNTGSARYFAPISGWYLAIQEVFFGQPTLTTSPSTLAEFQVSTNAGAVSAWDWYQHMNLPVGQPAGGATAMGYYYLNAGDSIAPGCQTQSTVSSGSFSTFTTGPQSHFEVVWVGE